MTTITTTQAEYAKWSVDLAERQTELRVADAKLTDCLAREAKDGGQPHYWDRRRKLAREVNHLLSQIDQLTRSLTCPIEPEPTAPAVDLEALTAGTNMTGQWFDEAVNRAMRAGLEVFASANGNPDTVNVRSQSLGTLHTVTRNNCTCAGFDRHGRCLHVALYIAWVEVFGSAPLPNPIHSGTRMTVRAAVAA